MAKPTKPSLYPLLDLVLLLVLFGLYHWYPDQRDTLVLLLAGDAWVTAREARRDARK